MTLEDLKEKINNINERELKDKNLEMSIQRSGAKLIISAKNTLDGWNTVVFQGEAVACEIFIEGIEKGCTILREN